MKLRISVLLCSSFLLLPSPRTSLTCRSRRRPTQLIVDGKPFLALARGTAQQQRHQFSNTMKRFGPKLAEAKLKPSWPAFPGNQIEPQEGKFDFSAWTATYGRHGATTCAWCFYGSEGWKNATSSYPPGTG